MWIAFLLLLFIAIFVMLLLVVFSKERTVDSFTTCSAVVPETSFKPSSFSTFDNLLLKSNNSNQLKRVDAVYQGNQLPISDIPAPLDTAADATNFLFALNQCKPECCPSTYSCDSGCVCATPEQNDFIATRGSNRHTDIW